MQRTLRLVCRRATEWGIATNRIGVMGFSAGGEVAFLSAQRFDSTPPMDRSADLRSGANLTPNSNEPGRRPALHLNAVNIRCPQRTRLHLCL